MKVICVIPAYNCAAQIVRVLQRLKDSDMSDIEAIWVIDNGSNDGTVQVANKAIDSLGLSKATVFKNSRNINLGGTHKLAFREAAKAGATHVLILHGDDQADAGESALLISRSRALSGATVLGSRFETKSNLVGYSKSRIFGNLVLNVLYSLMTLRRLTDLGSGLNLFNLKDVSYSEVHTFGNTLSFNYELILFLVKRRVDFSFEPISWSEEDQVSNARNLNIFLAACRILVFWRFGLPNQSSENQIHDVKLLETKS